MKTIARKQSVLVGLLLGLWVTAVLLPRSPLTQRVPARDSGVFLYLGQQILDGLIPYRDVWDHKGPGIYYVNALGLFLGQGSRWGVWGLQWLSLGVAASLGYIFLSQAFGHGPAIFASLVWLAALVFVLGSGNFTEEFALPFQFAAVCLFWQSQKPSRPLAHVFLIGITLAVAFLLKPNVVGVHLSIAVVAIISRLLSPHRQETLKWILALSAGAMTVSVPVIAYFVWNGAWDEFVDAVFRYNFIYTTSTWERKVNAMLAGLQLLARSGIGFTAMTAWIIGGLSLFFRPRPTDPNAPLLNVALVGLPMEFLLSSASGRTYGHYYVTWLPTVAILTAQFVFDFWRYFSALEMTFLQRKIELKLVWVLALLSAMMLPALGEALIPMAELFLAGRSTTSPIVERIQSFTDQDDYVLMWGAEAAYNFAADRRAPSRFVYQYPLYTCGYVTEAMITEFLDDIAKHKPLIVDTSSTNTYVPPLNAEEREQWDGQAFAGYETESCGLSPRMAEVFAFVNAGYRVAEVIQSNQWVIYRYVGGP